MRVLIVENSKVFLEIFTGIFSKRGYIVSTATSGAEAKEILKVGDFKIVCFGYELQDTNGCELAKYCRAQQIIKDKTPIFLITSKELHNTLLNEALQNGVTDVISRANVERAYSQIEKQAQGLLCQQLEHGKILYIEDDRAVAQATLSILSNISGNITHLTNASEAMAHLESQEYSLLLSDILVEGQLSVLSLIRMIRASKSNLSRIPIMLVTGFDDLARRIEFYREGINDYLIKPVHECELLVRVRNLIVNYQLITKAQEQASQIHWLTTHDDLTGCYNRNILPTNFSRAISDSIIKKQKIGLVLLDIDRFRWINENAGINAADNILAAVGKILTHNLKANEYVYRVGTDDFFIMTATAQDSKTLIDRVTALSKLIADAEYEQSKVTVTVGATIQDPSTLCGLEEILNALGNQIELARIKQGYNSVHYFDQINGTLN